LPDYDIESEFQYHTSGGPLNKMLTKISAGIAIITMLAALAGQAIAQSPTGGDNHKTTKASVTPAAQTEIEKLRGEVDQLRAELERLKSILEKGGTTPAGSNQNDVQLGPGATNSKQNQTAETGQQQPPAQTHLAPQSTAASDNPRIAIAPKAQGGDLSGAGNLLRTDRITIGGYGDFQFRQASLNERADGGGTPTFQFTRLVLGIAAVLAEKQNIVFNSELEYEFGSKEIDVEQAFVEWKLRPQFAVRGGIIVPSIGRFNVYHDSNLNLTTIRPLINQFIVPTAYRDAGIGVRGRFKLPFKWKLSYEADVVNGMQSLNADGEATPFSRLLGQSSAAEPGLVAFQAPNRRKAVAGRIGLSPINGLEFGVSAYNGRFNRLGEPPRSATILFVDGSYHRGPLSINGEYGRSNIVGGIPRKSPAPPIVDPNNPDSVAALAEFVAGLSPGQDGFYIEGAYNFGFKPRFLAEKFDDGGYIAPVFRYEVVRLDRTIPDFYLNRSRTTLGLNFAPSATIIFKMNYLFNHTFGPVPQAPAGVGGALFGISPLPHLGYGRNGFTGSIAYVF